jgi:hypothetical protein
MKLTPWLLLYTYFLTAPATATAAPGMWYYLCDFFMLLLSRCFVYFVFLSSLPYTPNCHSVGYFATYIGAFIGGVPLLWDITIQAAFPDALCRLGDGHSNGSIHASSMFNGDNGGEIEAWFRLNIVDPISWDCPHPDDAFPPDSSRRFQDYIPDIRSFGFQVWDIQNNQNSTGYLNIRNAEQQILLSGRADFLITDSAETLSSYLYKTLVIIEIQSQRNEDNCDRQMIAYLFLIMNTRALRSVLGFVIYTDGRCRAFKASRDHGNNCVYEQNSSFYICHLPTVIGNLLGRTRT